MADPIYHSRNPSGDWHECSPHNRNFKQAARFSNKVLRPIRFLKHSDKSIIDTTEVNIFGLSSGQKHHQQVCDEGCKAFALCIGKCDSVLLDEVGLTDKRYRAFVVDILIFRKADLRLDFLSLKRNKITPTGCQVLHQLANHCTSLNEICLSSNNVGLEVHELLQPLVPMHEGHIL